MLKKEPVYKQSNTDIKNSKQRFILNLADIVASQSNSSIVCSFI